MSNFHKLFWIQWQTYSNTTIIFFNSIENCDTSIVQVSPITRSLQSILSNTSPQTPKSKMLNTWNLENRNLKVRIYLFFFKWSRCQCWPFTAVILITIFFHVLWMFSVFFFCDILSNCSIVPIIFRKLKKKLWIRIKL